ncbi:MAG: RIP metalloprotease RseP [Bacillota bacterium]|nr:RIP metalloprotease RseP [Candidatus Fermentithermobacillaceae bacterium]
MPEIILAIVLLGILVTFHELGHFLAGRNAGVYIHEFAIGMGPVLFSWQGGETKYTIRMIPLGGFNRFAGEDARDKEDDEGLPLNRLLSSLSPGKRAGIIFAGPLANLLIAAFAFFIVFSIVGIYMPTTTIAEVMPGYPADFAGIRPGDKVLAINETPIQSWEDLTSAIRPSSGQTISLTLERDEKQIEVPMVPIEMGGAGVIGIRPTSTLERMNPVLGLYQGVKETLLVSSMWIQGIIGMLAGTVAPEVTGPIGITQILGEAARTGPGELAYLFGALSANLGLINLLPIPALDGSRLIFLAVEKLRGKPLDPEKESLVHFIGFFLLISVFVFVSYKDILRLVR